LTSRALEQVWTRLADEDPARADRALWQLHAASDGVAFLRKVLPVVKPVDAKRVQRLLPLLDSADYAVRQNAEKELALMGNRASALLRTFLASQPPLEAYRRAERLLHSAETIAGSPERLRIVRAVMVVELIGTAEARRLLREWSRGAQGTLLAEQAKEALFRLEKRSASR
jgi:hypothetical protein